MLALFISFNSFSCSIFKAGTSGNSIVAKSFDWSVGYGEIFIRPKNVVKSSLEQSHEWVSQYGSVTFSQFGPDLPIGGINEKGLIVEALVLSKTMYIESEEQILNEAEWIQYQLDNYSSINEVIKNIEKLKVKPHYVSTHYFLCDSSKECAVVEFNKSTALVYTKNTLPEPILTNSSYNESVKSLTTTKSKSKLAKSAASLTRFKLLKKKYLKNPTVTQAFNLLNIVELVGYTKWQYVYQLEKNKIQFKHAYSNQPILIDLNEIDFTCSAELKAISLEKRQTTFTSFSGDLIKRIEHKKISTQIKKALLKRPLYNNCSN